MGRQSKTTGGGLAAISRRFKQPLTKLAGLFKRLKKLFKLPGFFALKAHHHQKTNAANPAKPRAVGYMVATWTRKQKSPLG
jgi:hypothetical protein